MSGKGGKITNIAEKSFSSIANFDLIDFQMPKSVRVGGKTKQISVVGGKRASKVINRTCMVYWRVQSMENPKENKTKIKTVLQQSCAEQKMCGRWWK
jgi:hypothetical protein